MNISLILYISSFSLFLNDTQFQTDLISFCSNQNWVPTALSLDNTYSILCYRENFCGSQRSFPITPNTIDFSLSGTGILRSNKDFCPYQSAFVDFTVGCPTLLPFVSLNDTICLGPSSSLFIYKSSPLTQSMTSPPTSAPIMEPWVWGIVAAGIIIFTLSVAFAGVMYSRYLKNLKTVAQRYGEDLILDHKSLESIPKSEIERHSPDRDTEKEVHETVQSRYKGVDLIELINFYKFVDDIDFDEFSELEWSSEEDMYDCAMMVEDMRIPIKDAFPSVRKVHFSFTNRIMKEKNLPFGALCQVTVGRITKWAKYYKSTREDTLTVKLFAVAPHLIEVTTTKDHSFSFMPHRIRGDDSREIITIYNGTYVIYWTSGWETGDFATPKVWEMTSADPQEIFSDTQREKNPLTKFQEPVAKRLIKIDNTVTKLSGRVSSEKPVITALSCVSHEFARKMMSYYHDYLTS